MTHSSVLLDTTEPLKNHSCLMADYRHHCTGILTAKYPMIITGAKFLLSNDLPLSQWLTVDHPQQPSKTGVVSLTEWPKASPLVVAFVIWAAC